MSKMQEVKNKMRREFMETGTITFSGFWKPSRAWGYTCQGQYKGERFDTASGCGFCKQTAILESALNIIAATGKYYSLGSEKSQTVDGMKIILNYDGKTEFNYTIKWW